MSKLTSRNNIGKTKTKINFLEAYASFQKILEVTLPLLFPQVPRSEIRGHQAYLLHILTHKGKEYTVRYLKASFEQIETLLLETGHRCEYDKVSIGIDKDGWPKWLGSRLKRMCLVSKDIYSIRYCFTLCSARRLIVVPTFTDLSSITSPPTWESQIPIKEFMEDLDWHEEFTQEGRVSNPTIGSLEDGSDTITTHRVPKLQVSLKSSPNGVSYFAFPWDRKAVQDYGLRDKLSNFAETYFKGDVSGWISETLDPYADIKGDRNLHVGKISLTYEGGKLKPRIFAIVDSVTQTLLGNLHDDLMTILRDIPEDCTFNHDKVVDKARSEALKSKPFYGFADLSNATDRLPIYLYEEIGNWLSPNLGTAWVSLFNRPFSLGDSVIQAWKLGVEIPDSVRYQAGQPMGALSSWPFMALVHHCLVWYSFGSRKRAKGKYLLLGDDIVIFDKKAYEKYKEVLNTLGVSYTHNVSAVGFEFAKRTFLNGKEITGAYTQALWATRRNPELFVFEWRNLASRGYDIGPSLPEAFNSLLKVSRKRFFWLSKLVDVPYGTSISLERLAQWCLGLQGRSYCLLSHLSGEEATNRLVEATKAFRQVASLLIKQRFQSDLNAALSAFEDNKRTYLLALKKHSGLGDENDTVMLQAYNDVISEQEIRIRYLERDLKRMYLQPNDIQLLRPNLVDMPRPIDFSMRDKHTYKLVVRAEHQKGIIQSLIG